MYDSDTDSRITTRRFVRELLRELRQLSAIDQFRTLHFYFSLKFRDKRRRAMKRLAALPFNPVNVVNVILALAVLAFLFKLLN